MRRQITLAVLFVLVSILLLACKEMPKELKDKENIKSETGNENVTTDKLEFDTIENIFAKWNGLLEKEYENIKFDGTFTMDKPEEVGIIKFVQIGDFLDKKKKIVDHYLSDRFMQKYMTWEPVNVTPPGPEYDNEETGEHFFSISIRRNPCSKLLHGWSLR